MKKHNGEIDLIRLFFAVVICFGHWNQAMTDDTFGKYYIGVEFFFILSGYFMVRSYCKISDQELSNKEIGSYTWEFLLKKIKSFYRYYIFAVVLRFLAKIIIEQCGVKDSIIYILKGSPVFTLSFLALDVGDQAMYLGASWYLSGMLIALLILYPILLKFGDTATKVIFPIISLCIFGYFFENDMYISNWHSWLGFCYSGLLRAIADISLGAVLFPISEFILEKLKEFDDFRFSGIVFAVVKYSLWIVVFLGSVKNFGLRDIDMVFLISFAVILSFAVPKYSIQVSRFTTIASKLSLGIYIFHCVFRDTVKKVIDVHQIDFKQMILLFAISIAGSIILTYITDIIFYAIKKLCSYYQKKIERI